MVACWGCVTVIYGNKKSWCWSVLYYNHSCDFFYSLYYRKRFYTAAEALAVIDDIPSGSEDERLSGEDSDDAEDTFTPDANDAEECD